LASRSFISVTKVDEGALNNASNPTLICEEPRKETMMKRMTSLAVIVDDDKSERELLTVLLEESEMAVIQCASAEEALCVLEQADGDVSMLLTEINLAGNIDGVELAHFARASYPDIHVIVTSGREVRNGMPKGITFMQKPWLPLEVLREVELSHH
jgi:DNA-binding NtrC family response regulator